MKKDRKQIEREALDRAASGMVLTNYPAIFQGFMAKGIVGSDIKPRGSVRPNNGQSVGRLNQSS